MKFHHALKLTALAGLLVSSFAHAEYRIGYLGNVRPLIKFNELTRQEKVQLAQQAQVVLRDLYVNRYQKSNYYGTNPNFTGHVDPAAKVQQILNNIDKLSTAELHAQLSQTFVNQRDLHLNYNMPFPHAAFATFLPMEFYRTVDSANNKEVRFSQVWDLFFDVLYPGQPKPKLGDQVLEFDGVPIETAIANTIVRGNGANLYAGESRALQYLTFSPQTTYLPPAKDVVKIKFKSADSGQVFTATLPYLSYYDDAVLGAASKQANVAKASFTKEGLAKGKFKSVSNELVQEAYNKFVQQNKSKASIDVKALGVAVRATAEPTIGWGIFNRNGKKMGYLNITSFTPVAISYEEALATIANLLRNELAQTDGLLIDVRDNGGGYISYAEDLVQFFKPGNAKVNNYRLLNTKANLDFLSTDVFQFYWPEWYQAIAKASTTRNLYTQVVPITSMEEANFMGQMYYKPVGVLMNARSYSATDLFTCAMKDNQAATIYGENQLTGAGGANVLEYGFFNYFRPDLFTGLPDGVSMRVSWRQTVRNNYNNDIVEDYGCSADAGKLVPRTLADLRNGGLNQLTKIADDLLKQKPSASGYQFIGTVGNEIIVPVSAKTLSLKVTNTELIKVYVNNQLLKTHNVGVYGAARTVSVALPAMDPGSVYQLAIVGTDAGSAPLWNTKRLVVVEK